MVASSREEQKRKKLEKWRQRKYEAAILQYTGTLSTTKTSTKTPSLDQKPPPRKRVRRLDEMMPKTEAGVIEVLRGPSPNSEIWPETDDRLVQLTVVQLADDLRIPVLDLD